MTIHWISSQGGPYILTGAHTASVWGGVFKCSFACNNGVNTDYERACCGRGYAWVIGEAGHREILVIGDLPNDMMLYDQSDTAAILVKWVGANSNDHVLAALAAAGELRFVEQNVTFNISESNLVLFDSGNRLEEVGDNRIVLNLKPGRYRVGVLSFEPDDDLILQLYQLKRIDGPADKGDSGPWSN